jgi:23S rRNA (guanosine2251-2'-O)-methyltransferase
MNKDFSEKMLLNMDSEKQMKVLYTLATFIEVNHHLTDSTHFKKLHKYHQFLDNSDLEFIQKLNKEFHKVRAIDYQFEIYLMNLERLLGQSKKEYDFLVNTKDNNSSSELKEKLSIICLLDSVRSAHNVGAMIRNAECFNIHSLILTGLTPKADHPQVIKTAMDCDKIVATEYHKNAIDYIQVKKAEGFEIWAIETANNATHLKDITSRPQKLILLFGHEHYGLSHELLKLSDKIIDIELYGQKNSLNVSISQGIVLQNLSSL